MELVTTIFKGLGVVLGLIKEGKTQDAQLKLVSLQNDAMALMGQLEINKEQAKHNNIFISGARPFIIWTCGLALFNNYLIVPYVVAFFPHLQIPTLDSGLFDIMGGLLGISIVGLRTYEKKNRLTK